ncbi:sigma-70 family RNA polymerase sigma factor [Arcticibacter tournemirensis]
MPLLLDISGFEALFEVNYQPLCATAYRIVQDKDIAEGIVQDVFYKLWERRDSLRISSTLKAHLFQSTIDHSVNYIKLYRNAIKSPSQIRREPGSGVGFIGRSPALKEGHLVEVAVKSLPEPSRLVFLLSRYEQLCYKQIAERLDISVKTVETQMIKAFRYLKDYLLPVFLFFSCIFF